MIKLRFFSCLPLFLLLALVCATALERQPDQAYHARRVALAAKLEGGRALLFGADEPSAEYLDFRQDEDFYYLTGWNEPGAALVVIAPVPASAAQPAEPYREILFLPQRNLRMELYTGVKLDAASPDASKRTGVAEVRALSELPVILAERHNTPLWTQTDIPKSTNAAEWMSTVLGQSGTPALEDVRTLTRSLRSTKDAGELALLRKASDASIVAQRAAILSIRPGVNERAIAGLLDGTQLAGGCERPSYPPIVGSGKNSTVLHYSADDATMESGEVVVMDAAGEYSMYASDITRTVPVSGHFTDRQREIYNIVLGAQRAAAAAFVAGKSHINDPRHRFPDSLDIVAYNYINEHGKDLHGQPLGKYFIHGLGHSVGIDVHDPYDYTKPLEKGAVFTIEPGIYIPEEKIGVRIEDVFYVDENGKLVDLIAALPHTAEEVEALMHDRSAAGSVPLTLTHPATDAPR